MSFNPLTLLEKAINEHGSATILNQRLAAVKEELGRVEKERDAYKKAADDTQKEIGQLRSELEEYKKKGGFVEYRGVFFKRKAAGGYEPSVFCPICSHVMFSLEGALPFKCSRDGQHADFTGEQLPAVLRELQKEQP